MPEHKDSMGFKDKVHIVLTGPDGKVKDERKVGNETDEEHGVQNETGSQPGDQEQAEHRGVMPPRTEG